MPESDHQRGAGVGAVAIAGLLFALMMTLAYPPVNLWSLALLIPLPLAWIAVSARSTRLALAAGFLSALVMWLWIHRWMVHVTVVGYPALGVVMSLYTVLFVLILRWFARQEWIGRVPMAVAVPVVWVGVEFFRGDVLFHGYPWYLLGHPLIEWPVLTQSADLLGAYFISLLAALPAGVVLDVLDRRRSARQRGVIVAAAVVVLSANAAYGFWRIAGAPDGPPTLHVLLIQTNLPQDNKNGWTPQQQAEDIPRFVQMTTQALAEARRQGIEPDLIAWPETMLPGLGFEPDAIALMKSRFPARFAHQFLWHEGMQELVPQWNVPTLIGSTATVGAHVQELPEGGGRFAWDRRYNSAYLLLPDGAVQRYDKFFLTPFGETMPYISAWPWLEQKLLAVGARGMTFDLDASDELVRLTLPADGTTLSTPICFEDTIARVCRRMVWERGEKKSMLLINLSNDGWFDFFDGGRAHHVQVARFRAIENRVPVLRAVNTGYSVSIDSSGRVTGAIGPGRYGEAKQPGSLLAAVTLDDRVTVYASAGEVVGWLTLSLTATTWLGCVVLGRRSGKKADPSTDSGRSMKRE